MGAKRKHEDEADDVLRNDASSKRRKPSAGHVDGEAVVEQLENGTSDVEIVTAPHEEPDTMNGDHPAHDRPFFGMLDEDEQEYFKRADNMLESNSFGDDEERSLFLSNVYREAEGKELKIAQSQSCSRLMERLVQLSTPDQLKTLFTRLRGK